jgi:hypothetical protein
MSTTLHSVTVDTGCHLSSQLPVSCTFASVEVDIFNIEGVDVTRDVAEESQADVDKQVHATASDHGNANRRHYNNVSMIIEPERQDIDVRRRVIRTIRRAGAVSDILAVVCKD